MVEAARLIALQAHADQRYGVHPYSVHLEAVVAILQNEFAFAVHSQARDELIAAAWLHDAFEDTALTADDLCGYVSNVTLALVTACTDGPGANRAQRKRRPYALIPLMPNAILVKLADRIANAEASKQHGPPRLLEMYRDEHAAFCERLRFAPVTAAFANHRLWERLGAALGDER
jgi:(p)ppGpp synthase/HD superfamily hydrolase